MSSSSSDSRRRGLVEWTRNERRLGSPILAVPPPNRRKRGDTAQTQPAKNAPAAPRTAAPPLTGAPPRTAAPPRPDWSAPDDASAYRPPQLPARTAATARPTASHPGALPLAVPRQFDDGNLPPLCTTELSEDEARKALAELELQFVKSCRKCRLCEGRTQTVFGVGKARPDVVFVGEGPGADEDREGMPFVGRAGQLLTRMIAAMTLTRDQVYIANIVKCRPPENRTPLDDEMTACAPYLFRQLAILRPKVIVALGRPSAQTLLATGTSIGVLRGNFHDFPPLPLSHLGLPKASLMPTFHPAYLLRSPNEKAKVWEDLKQVMAFLGIPVPAK